MKDFEYYYNLFIDMLDLYEFSLVVDEKNNWRLIDGQGANLGGIEEDEFETLADIIDRMDAYHNDYIIEPLEEEFLEIEYSSWKDFYNKIIKLVKDNREDLSEWEWDIKVLDMIVNSSKILSNKEKNQLLKNNWRNKQICIG